MIRPTRRRFLQTTAAASAAFAAPTIIPASVLAQNAPSKRVNLAAIGVGGRGFGNCWHNFARYDDVRFVAVADCFATRREKFANQCNEKYKADVCKPYADYREVLERDDVDGIVVSTPDHWHVPVAYHAALARKHMYVEKPLGVAMAWAVKLRDAITKNNIVFQYGTQQRSMKSSQIAIDLVRNGYIGNVQRCEVWSPALGGPKWGDTKPMDPPADLDYDRWLGPAPVKPYTRSRCTSGGSWHTYDYALGFIAGWGAHPLDLLQWGMNADHTCPVEYEGQGKIAEGGLADTVYTWDIHCKYENGVPVRFMSADVGKPVAEKYHPRIKGDGTTFFGEDGWVSVSRGAVYWNRKGEMVNTSSFEFKTSDQRVRPIDSQARDFIDSVIDPKRPTINPFESAIRSDTISHMADIAIRTNSKVNWDPNKETIVGNPAAEKMLNRKQREPYTM